MLEIDPVILNKEVEKRLVALREKLEVFLPKEETEYVVHAIRYAETIHGIKKCVEPGRKENVIDETLVLLETGRLIFENRKELLEAQIKVKKYVELAKEDEKETT